ncbi:hypothetical protein [Glacieibacterium sp.]|uniref:hypothetical protein n=1 Tax=Glacieibacterium sp. TaxID=2860237 RepID=UPI003B00B0DB
MSWTLDSIDWAAFDATRVDRDLVGLVKAAALVEANAADYVAYLRGVFAGDDAFLAEVERWGTEEAQHGLALGRWAMLAEPGWDFDRALSDFRTGYQIEVDATASIRGSRTGELVARQVVETGTSSFYSALRDATDEPVLKAVAGRIAADEFAHYRLFAKAFARAPKLPLANRLRIAATRFAEAGDDELGWAWFAANVLPGDPRATYTGGVHTRAYAARALRLYRREHIVNGVRMTLRAVSLNPNGVLGRLVSGALWGVVRAKVAFG